MQENQGLNEPRWEHLSLCVLDVFFENELGAKESVKPLIQRFIDAQAVPLKSTIENPEDFKEYTVSSLLEDIEEMPAAKREAIFKQKNLSSLTIFLEMFKLSGLETLKDVQDLANDDQKVYIFRKVMEKKGYVNAFVDLTMSEVFKRREKVKRKDNNKQASPNAEKPALGVVKGLEIKEIKTKSRNIQLYPAAKGAFGNAVATIVSFVVMSATLFFAAFSNQRYNSSVAVTCRQIKLNEEQVAAQAATNPFAQQQAGATSGFEDLCQANASSQVLALVLFGIGIIALIVFAIYLTRTLKITLHNSFARAHNNFELIHKSFE